MAYLLNQTGVEASAATQEFLVRLNEAHIATRYPDNLAKARTAYPESVVSAILQKAKEIITWISKQY